MTGEAIRREGGRSDNECRRPVRTPRREVRLWAGNGMDSAAARPRLECDRDCGYGRAGGLLRVLARALSVCICQPLARFSHIP
jgi:hypothetical protein